MSQDTIRTCAYIDCDEEFEPSVHNHIYHSEVCKRKQKNARKRRDLVSDLAAAMSPFYDDDDDDFEDVNEFLRRENKRLSNLVFKHKRNKAELVEAFYYAVHKAISEMEIPPVKPPPKSRRMGKEEVANPILSDFQCGKKTATYNSEVCRERIDLFADKVLAITDIHRSDHPIKRAHVHALGDIVEGEDIFPGQPFELDSSLYRQMVTGVEIMADFLRRMLASFETVHFAGVIGNHGCCDDQTEALTPSGWKKVGDIKDGEPIKIFDPNTGEVKWDIPERWNIYPYEGELLHFSSTLIDQMVTPDHSMWGRKSPAGGVLGKHKAKEFITRKIYSLVTSGSGNKGYASILQVPSHFDSLGRETRGLDIHPNEDWAEFFGWYVSEGGVEKTRSRIVISQSERENPEFFQRIQKLLTRLGFNWSVEGKNIRFSNIALGKWLIAHFGRVSGDKRIPPWLKEWPYELLIAFMRGYAMGDGTKGSKGFEELVYGNERGKKSGIIFTTTSDRLIDDLQELCLHLGWGSAAKERYYSEVKGQGYIGSARKLHVSMKNETQFRRRPPTLQWYQGEVFCPTVSTGLWVTRRNGKVSITGNSLSSKRRGDYNPETNMDRLLYKFISMLFEDEPRITFDIPDGSGESSFYTVDHIGNYKVLLMHGDQLSKPTSIHSYYKKVLGWKDTGIPEDFDDVICGHWHQNTKATLGTVVLRITGTPESDNTFAQEKIGVMGRPSQHFQFIEPEKGLVTAEYDIYLDDV